MTQILIIIYPNDIFIFLFVCLNLQSVMFNVPFLIMIFFLKKNLKTGIDSQICNKILMCRYQLAQSKHNIN